jgi:CheY-like chemotaxis protein
MQPILYLDDDESEWLLLERALRGSLLAGAVQWFSSASFVYTAIEQAEIAELPRSFLLDWHLAGDCSEPVIRRIKEHPSLANCPIIVMTSSGPSPANKKTLKDLDTHLIEKPSSPAQYRELIDLLRKGVDTLAPF